MRTDYYDKQLTAFDKLASELQMSCKVVSSHTSKSQHLPVVRLNKGDASFYLRDNFYDINVCGISRGEPFTTSISDLFKGIQEPKTWDWYLEQIARCRGYSWEYFTDEEMDDPRILRVFKPHKHSTDSKPMEWKHSADEKDRWIKRLTDPEWIEKDWSHNRMCWEGTFGPGVQIYLQDYPHMEGISDVANVREAMPKFYAPNCTAFALAVDDLTQAKQLIRNLVKE